MIRVELRNEYGLGAPELYKNEAVTGDDPKALLDGVAVSGLVGILRQLGDLAEFAAEVFHGLQEQVTMTSSRSHKLMSRVQRIEAALPSLEKAVLSQKSHLHFAYTAGSYWHPRLRCEKHHFIYSDLPRFVMDSYEESRGPPRLHLLDKFDTGGPGSCLKRYSDPTFFRRASGKKDGTSVEKHPKDKKSRRNKKRSSWRKNREVSQDVSSASFSGRMHFGQLHVDVQTSPSRSSSAYDGTTKPDQVKQSNSIDSRNGPGYIDCVFHSQLEEQYSKESSSPSVKQHDGCIDYAFLNESGGVLYDSNNTPQTHSGKGSCISDNVPNSLLEEQNSPVSPYLIWDRKADKVEPELHESYHDEILETFPRNFEVDSVDRETYNIENIASETIDQTATHESNHEGNLGTFSSSLEAGTINRDTVDFEIVDHCDLQLGNGEAHVHTTDDVQLEDIESETDNFMDALNSIESESETDVDYQTKQERGQFSKFNKKSRCDEINGIRLQNSDSHAFEFDIDAATRSTSCQESLEYSNIPGESKSHLVEESNLENVTARDESNLNSLEHPAHLQSPQMATTPLHLVSLPDVDSRESSVVHEGPSVESLVRNSSSSTYTGHSLAGVASDKITSNPSELQKPRPRPNPAIVTSVQFWTNGGLLGLQPSKPPDFGVVNAASQATVAITDETANVAQHTQHKQDSDVVNESLQNVLYASSSNCSTSYQDDEEGGFSRWKIARRLPSADLDVRHQKLSNNDSCNNISINNGLVNGLVKPGDLQGKTSENGDKSSFGMFDFGNKLLANGFHRNLSFDREEKPNSTSSLDMGVLLDQNRQQSVAYRTFSGRSKDFSRGGSPILSPSSSPPLGHMKISFQPVDGSETSKLELKFPNGSNGHESFRDIFPSFHLVPEPSIPLHDINSNSDEDTFCRSSPYSSDDCLSRQSESNSELWESGESSAIKDHELYDALRRISLTESVSTSMGTSGMTQGDIRNHSDLQISFPENVVGRSQSAHFSDLPSFDTENPPFKQDYSDNSNSKSLVKSYSLNEPTPPPLPPMEWRGTTPPLDVAEDRQQSVVPEAPSYAFDLKPSKSTISQQPKPAPLGQDQIVEAASMLRSKEQVGRSLSVPKETNQAAYGKVTEEKEDFLQQIRTKSFNLRRTATTKPTVSTKPTFQTGLPSSVKVTAILEKANAIRQAVGSDDGDDDSNWSDT